MLRFTFESFFKDKNELREEVTHLLWQIDNTWPMSMFEKQIDWMKERTDNSFLKVNGGAKRQSIEVVKNIHQHKDGCKFCKPGVKL